VARKSIRCEAFEVRVEGPQRDEGRVWFQFADTPVVAVVSMALNGTVLGCELHVVGTDGAYPDYPDDYSGTDHMYAGPFHDGPVPGVSIGTRMMRSIPWGELITVALAFLRADAEDFVRTEREGAPPWLAPREWLADLQERALREPGRRPGRRGHPDEVYADLAVKYESWVATGRPLDGLAEREGYSESGLRAAIKRARDLDLLTKTKRGAAGGQATERARELVRRLHREGQRGVG
jgi:hypothetical protein